MGRIRQLAKDNQLPPVSRPLPTSALACLLSSLGCWAAHFPTLPAGQDHCGKAIQYGRSEVIVRDAAMIALVTACAEAALRNDRMPATLGPDELAPCPAARWTRIAHVPTIAAAARALPDGRGFRSLPREAGTNPGNRNERGAGSHTARWRFHRHGQRAGTAVSCADASGSRSRGATVRLSNRRKKPDEVPPRLARK